jgi:hypothetical protein
MRLQRAYVADALAETDAPVQKSQNLPLVQALLIGGVLRLCHVVTRLTGRP